ncbi:hypothetical protein AB0K16_22025 [Nonomuraea jabiensis]|uniref:hypothetical protein n=1 Tax=Nonomuraea jabiensis TaxID=882448 RepID=UPI0034443355
MDRSKITGEMVLAVKMQPNDADAETIRDYLVSLVEVVWNEKEGFSGKRPFGNSGWDWDLYETLVRADFIDGLIEDGDYLEEFDREAGDRLIRLAIKDLRRPVEVKPKNVDVDGLAMILAKNSALVEIGNQNVEKYWKTNIPDFLKDVFREHAKQVIEYMEKGNAQH